MKRIIKNLLGIIGVTTCALSFLVGCASNADKGNESQDDVITKILNESEPNANVHIGPYEPLERSELKEVDESSKTYGSSTILDMPKDGAINVVYDNSENRSLQSVSCLLNNIVNANNDVHIISIKDRGGNYKNNLLSSDGEKLIISSAGGFAYGEVYQIEINNAPYLSFENKDPEIRKLTIEIEDSPVEEDEYDVKEIKENIVKIDRNKISNKKQIKNKDEYEFDYDGDFPALKKGDVFFANKNDNSDYRLDFYGVFVSNKNNHVTYRSASLDEIYDNFHLKGIKEAELDEAEILLNNEFVVNEFKQSSLARGLVKTLLNLSPDTYRTIIDIIRHLNVDISINVVGNRVSTKIALKLGSYKIKDNHYIAIEIGHENITDYIFDFDVKLSYSWIFPTGVDYKIKCIEDSQDIWYFRFAYDHQPISSIKESDTDYADKLLDDIMNSLDGKSSKTGELLDKDNTTPSTSGTKTTFPLVYLDINYFTPLQIRFKIDFYFDIGLQAIGLVKHESYTRKVDFNFSNMNGGSQDSSNEILSTSNIFAYIGGGFHIEAGLRLSLGISIFGLYDYLHVEGYAEVYINLSINGMIAANIDFSSDTFSGYYSIDLALTAGVKAGLNIKAIVTSFNLAYNWSWYLFRMKFDCPIEHWSSSSPDSVDMNKETMSINETNVLLLDYFDPLTLGIKEKKYTANDEFSIISGILAPDWLINLTKGHTFTFKSNDNRIEVNEDGLIHVKDGTENAFVASLTIHVSSLAGFVGDKTITINYTASDIKDVYIGDELYGQFRPGYKFELPETIKIRGKEFEYYSYNGNEYHVGETFTVPNESVTLIPHYRDLPTYRVYFYDGYGILVSFDEVYEGEDAHEPDPLIRDRYMDEGWEFAFWSRSFKNVHKELHVSSNYIRVG